MANFSALTFYHPIPRIGEKFFRQLGDMRENSNSLGTIVRAALADTDSPSTPENHSLSGLAFGEKGFHNKFRQIYDKTVDEYKLQFNSGTQAVPVWTTCVRIREEDCRFIIQGTGGLELHGGFYPDSLISAINVRDSDDSVAGARKTINLTFNSDGFYTSGTSRDAETMVNLRYPRLLVKESETGGYAKRTDEIAFDSDSGFYVGSAGNGAPIVSLADAFSATQFFSSAAEWQ